MNDKWTLTEHSRTNILERIHPLRENVKRGWHYILIKFCSFVIFEFSLVPVSCSMVNYSMGMKNVIFEYEKCHISWYFAAILYAKKCRRKFEIDTLRNVFQYIIFSNSRLFKERKKHLIYLEVKLSPFFQRTFIRINLNNIK